MPASNKWMNQTSATKIGSLRFDDGVSTQVIQNVGAKNMIEKEYNLSVSMFSELLEQNGGEFMDETPTVLRYSVMEKEIYFNGDDSRVNVSAEHNTHNLIQNWIRPQQ